MPSDWIIIGILGCVTTAMLALGVLGASREARLKRKLASLSGSAGELGTGSRLGRAERFLVGTGKDRDEIVRGLRAAGYYDPRAVALFGILRLAATVLAMAGVALALWLAGAWSGFARFYPLAAGGVVYILSKTVLRWRASARMRRVNAELPFTLDMLLLMLESGISLDQCFRSIAQAEGGAIPQIKQSMRALVEDIQRGMAYDQALARWADRLGVDGARELASMFRQTLQNGTELGGALREFVKEFFDRRVTTARESIGRKTTQMTLVMVAFLMPALFIVLGAPAAVSIVATLSGMGK